MGLPVMRMVSAVMMVAVVMMPVMRRVREAGTRKQTQRNGDSDDLAHNFRSNLLEVGFPGVTSIALRRARCECLRVRHIGASADYRTRVFQATHSI